VTYLEGMQQVVVFPDRVLPAKLTLNPKFSMDDDQYYEFCMASPDVRFERTEHGEIIIVPPAGPESDHRSLDVGSQLHIWAERDGRGKAFGSSAGFILPTGAALSPDAAWVSNVRLSKLSKNELRKFPRLIPEFVIEVMSPSDRIKRAKEKMETWLRGGVELAWLIDGDRKAVHIYRATGAELRSGIAKLLGEGPVKGFKLDLEKIWAGL
jgi:Uma2 family endonuclease